MTTVVDHLTNLIRIPSVSALSNRPVIDYLERVLHEAGWQIEEMRYQDASGIEKINLITAPSTQKLNDPAGLAFLCHTDTVPYAASWTNALNPLVAEEMLYGCGACDVKGFLACLLTAIGRVNADRWIDGLRVVFTADEEIGCAGAARFLAENRISPQRLIIGEPTSLHPARAGKGYSLAEITIFGREAHSAHPERGVSAISGAAHLILEIEALATRLAEQTHDFFAPNHTTLNVGTIRGGTAKNIVSGECSFLLEWRPIPGQPPCTVPEALAEIIERLRHPNRHLRYETRILRQQEGFETSATAPLVRLMETLTGRAAISIPFGSEASLLSTVAEEVVVFGPGDMQTAHSSRECVPLSELDEAVHCLQSLMTNSCQE
jgi:acetylornithine deacetylase